MEKPTILETPRSMNQWLIIVPIKQLGSIIPCAKTTGVLRFSGFDHCSLAQNLQPKTIHPNFQKGIRGAKWGSRSLKVKMEVISKMLSHAKNDFKLKTPPKNDQYIQHSLQVHIQWSKKKFVLDTVMSQPPLDTGAQINRISFCFPRYATLPPMYRKNKSLRWRFEEGNQPHQTRGEETWVDLC